MPADQQHLEIGPAVPGDTALNHRVAVQRDLPQLHQIQIRNFAISESLSGQSPHPAAGRKYQTHAPINDKPDAQPVVNSTP